MSDTAGAPGSTWTLGHREGEHQWWCVYCGRNCLADGLEFVQVGGPPSSALWLYACPCCRAGYCQHRKPVVIECEGCHRPVGRLTFGGGKGGAMLLGGRQPEGSLRGGIQAVNDTDPKWSARLWDVSPDGAPWNGSEGDQRLKIVCIGARRGARHRVERIVTREALGDAYALARQRASLTIGLTEIRRAEPGPRRGH